MIRVALLLVNDSPVVLNLTWGQHLSVYASCTRLQKRWLSVKQNY